MSKRWISLVGSYYEALENRLHGCIIISPRGRAVHNFRSVKELSEVFREVQAKN
jgi:hypothetical protein